MKYTWVLCPIFISACFGGTSKSPGKFITGIYAQYQARRPPDLLGAGGDTLFTPRLLGMYREFSKNSHERHGLGWDPLCWCDDKKFPGYDISEVKIKIIVLKPDYAEIDVLLKVGGFGEGGVLVLKKSSERWLIDDIRDGDSSSLYEYLETNLNSKKIPENH